jgi:hypothetical protein
MENANASASASEDNITLNFDENLVLQSFFEGDKGT